MEHGGIGCEDSSSALLQFTQPVTMLDSRQTHKDEKERERNQTRLVHGPTRALVGPEL